MNSPIPVVQQIWHGDSINLAKHFHAMRRIKSVITDPPFGVDNKSKSAVTPHGRKYARKIANDATFEQAAATFTAVSESVLPGMMDDSDMYIFTSWQVLDQWIEFTRDLLTPHGFNHKAILVWEKSGPGQGDLESWGMGIEFCLYFKRGKWQGRTRRGPVLHHQQVHASKLIHPHEKPEDLLIDLMRHSTQKGDVVLDPFGGSGSLARAARRIDRSAVSIEMDKMNYDLALKKFNEGDSDLFTEA